MALISFVWTCVDLIILHCTTQLPCEIPVFLTPTTFCFFSYSTILHYYWTLHNLSLFFSPQSTKNGYFTRFFFYFPHTHCAGGCNSCNIFIFGKKKSEKTNSEFKTRIFYFKLLQIEWTNQFYNFNSVNQTKLQEKKFEKFQIIVY